MLTRSSIRRRFRRGRARHRARAALATAGATVMLLLVTERAALAQPAGDAAISGVIDRLTLLLVGLLVSLATLVLTIGGVRYLAAGGDPSEIGRAKTMFKSAVIGYAVAALAPALVGILKGVVGR